MNEESTPLIMAVIMTSLFSGIIILYWVLLAFMPRWTRPDIYFSVTVRPAFRNTPEARKLERRFRWLVALHSVIGLFLVMSSLLIFGRYGFSLGLLLAGLFWQIGGTMAAFVSTHRRVVPHGVRPVGQREAILTPRSTRLAGGWLWLGPWLILLGFAAYLALNWGNIPDRFPTHWGPSGRPDSWAGRNFLGVFMLPLFGAFNGLILLGIAMALPRFSRRIFSRGAAAEREQKFMRITQWILLGMAYWLSAMMGTGSLLPLCVGENDPLPPWFFWSIASELILVVGILILLARSGQGGWRLPAQKGELPQPASEVDEEPVGDRTPDSAWKWGMFYYNPEDPALFVEKRFGIGWDFNWARPAAWGTLLTLLIGSGIIALIVAVAASYANSPEPRMVETVPVHGSSDISPDLQEIRIRFDQPMNPDNYSVTPGGGNFPEIAGDPHWADDHTFVLPVHVQPGRMYEVMINRKGDKKFRSREGKIAPSAVIDFQTATTGPASAG